MITTVIFDIGNVLVDFCWEDHLNSFGFSKEINEKLAKATVLTKAWDELDRGRLSEQEILQLFLTNDPSIEKEIRMFFKNLKGVIHSFDYTNGWIDDLKRDGYQVYYLSNFSEKVYREAREELQFLDKTDGGILSYTEKIIKPEKEIYEKLIERYHLVPENCVFFDDKPENVQGAINSGIHGIVFTNQIEAIKKLEDINN